MTHKGRDACVHVFVDTPQETTLRVAYEQNTHATAAWHPAARHSGLNRSVSVSTIH